MQTKTNTPLLLLVEDSDDDTFFFKRTLKKSGLSWEAHFLINGVRAVEFLQAAAVANPPTLPRVIFLDLKMPLMNGFEVLEWLQKQNFPTPVKVVVLSGSDHQEDKTRAFQLGAADYLVKPVVENDLKRILADDVVVKPEMGASV